MIKLRCKKSQMINQYRRERERERKKKGGKLKSDMVNDPTHRVY